MSDTSVEHPHEMAEREADQLEEAARDVREHDHLAEWGDQETIRFFPDHFISEATAMVLLLCLYSVLAIFLPAFLDIKANPAVTPTGSKPEWYFLFLFAFLHYVPPLVGTLAPMALLVLLGVWPWIDRNPSRKPSKRIFALALAVVVVVIILALTALGALE